MRFTFADTLRRLDGASDDPHFGRTIDIPAPSMPTITIKVHKFPQGWRNQPYRRAANTIYVVMRGHGRSVIGEQSFDWQFGDTIAAPAWSRIEHHAAEDSIVFSMSDEALMQWAKYYRLESL
jgi:gentisate 1,2-dioxygenase